MDSTDRHSIFGGSNSGQHDFGYTGYMPTTITIDSLTIDDKNRPTSHKGPTLLANFNRNYKTASYKEKYPCVKKKEVILKNVTTASCKPVGSFENPVMFKSTRITVDAPGVFDEN